jgi:hypothetical protein
MPDGKIVSSLDQSDVLQITPPVAVDFVFAAPEARGEVARWLGENRERIIQPRPEEEKEAESP